MVTEVRKQRKQRKQENDSCPNTGGKRDKAKECVSEEHTYISVYIYIHTITLDIAEVVTEGSFKIAGG